MKASEQTPQILRSSLACVEIGLTEIERAAKCDVSQMQLQPDKITRITIAALHSRPEHVADILLVSSWLLAEALCSEEQRAGVRQHYQAIAQMTEESLACT